MYDNRGIGAVKQKYNVKFYIRIAIAAVLTVLAVVIIAARAKLTGSPESNPEATFQSVLQVGENDVNKASDPAQYEGLIISEVMSRNSAVLADESGEFPDWIELFNSSAAEIELEGCLISDKPSGGWSLPELKLSPGGYCLIYADGKDIRDSAAMHADFSISDEETISLRAPSGKLIDSLTTGSGESNCSFAVQTGKAGPVCTCYPTPGYENSTDGYIAWQETLAAPDGLLISEVAVDGSSYLGTSDFIELYNSSSAPVNLSSYTLSDDADNPGAFSLGNRELMPGEYIVVNCGDGGENSAPFSLDSKSEKVYLFNSLQLADYAAVRDVPAGCSYGRTPGSPGWFYYSEPTPLAANGSGWRKVSSVPSVNIPDGIYNGVDSVSVELSGEGTVYYTLDCSTPTGNSNAYSGPVELSSTAVIKAIAVEAGMMPSPVAVFTYIINENHTMPVLSLTGKDPAELIAISSTEKKLPEIPGTFSYYDGEGSFTVNCGIKIYGRTSLRYAHKNFKLHFRSCYGDSSVDYDLFGNGIESFNSLALKKGQDNRSLIFMNEMWEKLCISMGEKALAQSSKFCILYLNGEYYGICSLREDFSRQFYASRTGCSKESVDVQKTPMGDRCEFFNEVVRLCAYNQNMSDEVYEKFCGMVDIDSFIDWLILEGVSGNFDLCRNIVFFRSPELDNKWHVALYDLDWAFNRPYMGVFGNTVFKSAEVARIVTALCSNETFLERFLTRYAEVSKTILSDENIAAVMDEYVTVLSPEVERDRERWNYKVSSWEYNVSTYKGMILDSWSERCINAFFAYAGHPELKSVYFNS